MPLNAIQQQVKGLIDQLTVPTISEPLTAWITPPVIEEAEAPRAYVWGGTLSERRQTAPRGSGFKKLNWTVDIWVVYRTVPDDEDLDEAFPVLLDAIMATLRAAPMPVPLADPTTGVTSQLLSIGEDFQVEYPPERLAGDMSIIWYAARIAATVEEALQG